MLDDTIVAISTPLAEAGIGIIRISGDKALNIISKIFKPVKNLEFNKIKTHTIHYGNIFEKDRLIDEVLVSFMFKPQSYTKEDVIEINAHGGMVVMQEIVSLVIKNGARMAEPGEFTKRAFLNGRLDLSQAEAVMDIISAKNKEALTSSVNQLNGTVKNSIEELKSELLKVLASIEVNIDYPEYEEADLDYDVLIKRISNIKLKIEDLINTYSNGKIIKEGIKTAIIGRPNVGKSSLLNALLRDERAIVTDIPGTTRDSVEEYMNINGIMLKLIDTAGIRSTEDVVEKLGVEKSKSFIDKADLVFMVIDASSELDVEDFQILELVKNKECIILMNKADLKPLTKKEQLEKYNLPIIDISAKNLEGLDKLENRIRKDFSLGKVKQNNTTVISSLRHKESLERANDSLDKVVESIEIGMSTDFLTIDLNDAYEELCEITGDKVTDDVISKIFSQFCLGK